MIALKNTERQCKYCGAAIEGRPDKMFCDDNCRNNYYYRLNNEDVALVRNVNSVLLHNRRILKKLNPGNKVMVLREILADLKFDFQYFTGIYKTKKGETYYLVYDQAYRMSGDYVVIIRYCRCQTIL